MTEQQYPIHLRKIGEPVIAQFLEDLMQEIDTHEKMFLELCQVKRERDAAVDILVGFEYPIPCESDELGGSEYCEEHCTFKAPQKECWLKYFEVRGSPEVKADE